MTDSISHSQRLPTLLDDSLAGAPPRTPPARTLHHRTPPPARHSARAAPVVLVALAGALVGCAGLSPDQQAAVARVEVIRLEPATNCQNLGPVSGSRDSDGSGGVRAKAVLRGGNTVHLDSRGDATAFYCPPAPEPSPEPTP